jgi:hypothetical protein
LPTLSGAPKPHGWKARIADVLTEEALPTGRPLGLDPLAELELTCWRWRAGGDIGPQDNLPEPYRMLLAGDRQGASRWWLENGSPYEAALAMAGSGDVPALRAAVELLSGLGARSAVLMLVRELRALGERLPRTPRPATSANPAGLTAREIEILRLIAGGDAQCRDRRAPGRLAAHR